MKRFANKRLEKLLPAIVLVIITCAFTGCKTEELSSSVIAEAWAGNSVNTVIFRRHSVVTHGDTQYAAFYDQQQHLVLAKRKLGTGEWTVKQSRYKGNATDAHNSISIAVDGAGFLHVAWDHHNNPLRYSRSVAPGSLELQEEMPMTGLQEERVTYPEFYALPQGNLLFLYRSGVSGNGDLVMNLYDVETKQWTQIQNNLIDGQGERNAYWQACVDPNGTIHLSWVWRETWDVASNHDICYARSKDGGRSWENSDGEAYALPINAQTAEVAWEVPQNSELINQTSMTTDDEGSPIIATYWRKRDSNVPQYQLVYHNGVSWHATQASARHTPFSLSGGGTKRIPISRPQIVLKKSRGKKRAVLIFRDEERGSKVSVAVNRDFPKGNWEVSDLSEEGVGAWEPTYDVALWQTEGILHLFVQEVEQLDNEGLAIKEPEVVRVLEWKPSF